MYVGKEIAHQLSNTIIIMHLPLFGLKLYLGILFLIGTKGCPKIRARSNYHRKLRCIIKNIKSTYEIPYRANVIQDFADTNALFR